MKLGDMSTQHILNHSQGEQSYLAWMWRACGDATDCGLSSIKHAQQVLGSKTSARWDSPAETGCGSDPHV